MDMESTVNRETLRWLVQREITCAMTGRVLDIRSAVAVTVTVDGKPGTSVFAGKAYDAIAEKLGAAAVERGATLEILDGRVLFGKRKAAEVTS